MNIFPSSDDALYEIQVKSHVNEQWSSRFDGLTLTNGFAKDGTPITTLSGPVADQAALHGVLARIRDMGLELLKVKRVGQPETGGGSLGSHEFP